MLFLFRINRMIDPGLTGVPYINTPIRYTLAEMIPMKPVVRISSTTDIIISYHLTVLIAILANIAIGDVNGM